MDTCGKLFRSNWMWICSFDGFWNLFIVSGGFEGKWGKLLDVKAYWEGLVWDFVVF